MRLLWETMGLMWICKYETSVKLIAILEAVKRSSKVNYNKNILEYN